MPGTKMCLQSLSTPPDIYIQHVWDKCSLFVLRQRMSMRNTSTKSLNVAVTGTGSISSKQQCYRHSGFAKSRCALLLQGKPSGYYHPLQDVSLRAIVWDTQKKRSKVTDFVDMIVAFTKVIPRISNCNSERQQQKSHWCAVNIQWIVFVCFVL